MSSSFTDNVNRASSTIKTKTNVEQETLLGNGYRGIAYSNLAELKSLLEQKISALAEELEEEYEKETKNMASKLDVDLDYLRKDLDAKHKDIRKSLRDEDMERIRLKNAAALEKISKHYHVRNDMFLI